MERHGLLSYNEIKKKKKFNEPSEETKMLWEKAKELKSKPRIPERPVITDAIEREWQQYIHEFYTSGNKNLP